MVLQQCTCSTEQQWLNTGASDRKVSGVAAALRLLVFVLPNAGLWTAWLLLQPAKRRDEPSVTDTLAFDGRSRIGGSDRRKTSLVQIPFANNTSPISSRRTPVIFGVETSVCTGKKTLDASVFLPRLARVESML